MTQSDNFVQIGLMGYMNNFPCPEVHPAKLYLLCRILHWTWAWIGQIHEGDSPVGGRV